MSAWDGILRTFRKDLAVRGFTPRSSETHGQNVAAFLAYLDSVRVQHPADITLDVLRAYQTHLHDKTGARGKRLTLSTQARHLAAVRSFCGCIRQALGRTEGIEESLRLALALRENVLGPEHADLARTIRPPAEHLMHTGRMAEAEPLFDRAVRLAALPPEPMRVFEWGDWTFGAWEDGEAARR